MTRGNSPTIYNSSLFRLSLGILAIVTFILPSIDVAFAKSSRRRKSKERSFVFSLQRIDLPNSAKQDGPRLKEQLRKSFAKGIEQQPRLLPKLPEDAPKVDWNAKGKAGNRSVHRYLKKRKIKAYRVTLQVQRFALETAPNPKKIGKILTADIAVHVFGETIPDRVMGFSGDGSAKLMIEVGHQVKDADKGYALEEAVTLAVEKALQMGLNKLSSSRSRSSD